MSTAPSEARPPVRSHDNDLPRIQGTATIASLRPLGLGLVQPLPVAEALRTLWSDLPTALSLVVQGPCDGCSLGTTGRIDPATGATHLCQGRLDRIAQHTLPALAPADLLDLDRLRGMTAEQLQRLGRLPCPFVHRPGERGFSRATWDEALALIASLGAGVAAKRTGFLASDQALSLEAHYAFAKAARLLGTGHIDTVGGPSLAAAGAELVATLGTEAATCSASDVVGTDLLLVLGTPPRHDRSSLAQLLVAAKRRGTRVVVVDPQLHPELACAWSPVDLRSSLFGSQLTDDFVAVSPGGHGAFMAGVLKAVLERGATDSAFIDAHTTGFDSLKTALDAASWESLAERAGCLRRDMEWVAELFVRARTTVTVPVASVAATGDGVVALAVALHLASGRLGRQHCGLLPLGCGPGALGARLVGVAPDVLPGSRPADAAGAAELSECLGGVFVSPRVGHGAAALMAACANGEIDVVYSMSADLTGVCDDAVGALSGVALRIHQATVLDPSMLVEPGAATVLLPAQGLAEQDGGGTLMSIDRHLRYTGSLGACRPVGAARAAWQIPGRVVAALDPDLKDAVVVDSMTALVEELSSVVPMLAWVAQLKSSGDFVQCGGPQLPVDPPARVVVPAWLQP